MKDALSQYLEDLAAVLEQEDQAEGTTAAQDALDMPRQAKAMAELSPEQRRANMPQREEHVRVLPDAERNIRLKRRMRKLLED
jgi:hypothetical protein